MLLFYVRHGDPIYDPDSLTPLGRRQAESVAHRLCQFGLDRIFASTSNRAVETARPTCEILGLEPVQLDWVNESHAWRELSVEFAPGRRHWCYCDEEILTLFADPEVRALGPRWYEHPAFAERPTFGEAVRRMRAAADDWLASLGYRHDAEKSLYHVEKASEERVALFAHEGAGMLFLSTILDIPYPLFSPAFTMQHTGVTVVEFRSLGNLAMPCVLQLSNDSHLFRDGLPLNYQKRVRF